jgi:Acyl carrier protein
MSTVDHASATLPVIREFIMKQFPLARQKQVSDNDSLLQDGIIDSLGTLDVVMFIEERFGLVLEDDDLLSDNFESISRLSNFVEGKLNS